RGEVSGQAGAMARHVAKRGSIAPAGADEKAVGAVGANEHLLSGQTERPLLHRHLRAWRKWIVAVRALLERRNDECRACHQRFQHWMRRAPQPPGGRRNPRKPGWLPDRPPPGPPHDPREPGPRPGRGRSANPERECQATRVPPPAADVPARNSDLARENRAPPSAPPPR